MIVTNVAGTSQLDCCCGSWLKHWEKLSGQTTTYCVQKICLNKDLVGAHVQKAGDSAWYIIPLCSAHNQSTSKLDVMDSTAFVSANKRETCEKSTASRSYW
jgi:hypothetical protein